MAYSRKSPIRRIIDYTVLLALIAGTIWFINNYARSDLSGSVIVIDGDSLRINGEDIRLYAIDAPELHQSCLDNNGNSYQCGKSSRDFLKKLIARQQVKCSLVEYDRYDRAVSRCKVGNTDLSSAMVANGWAVAYLRISLAYVRQEAKARKARLGIWQGDFEEPEDWRYEQRRGFAGDAELLIDD